MAVGHEANGGGAVQEHGGLVLVTAPKAVQPLPVLYCQVPIGVVDADDGKAFDGAGIDIGNAIAAGTTDDGGHGIARAELVSSST